MKSDHTQTPSRQKAILWCSFLGFAGAHRFYLGQKGWGALYLIFSWTGIPLFVALVDLVTLVVQDDDEFMEERYEDPNYCHRSIVMQLASNKESHMLSNSVHTKKHAS